MTELRPVMFDAEIMARLKRMHEKHEPEDYKYLCLCPRGYTYFSNDMDYHRIHWTKESFPKWYAREMQKGGLTND